MAEKRLSRVAHAGGTPLLHLFKDGSIVVLWAKSNGQSLRVRDGCVEGYGGTGELAQFYVHVRSEGVVAFKNVADPTRWLRISEGNLNALGGGGVYCDFKVEEHDGYVVFESVKFPGQHVGIKPDGSAKPPDHTGTGDHARFTPQVLNEKDELIVPGTSPLQSQLAHGNIVVLKSKVRRSLRINSDGVVEGFGEEGQFAQFIVHVRGTNRVALQNVHDPNRWIKIKNNKLTGDGNAGKYCELNVKEYDGYLVFESVCFPGQHVGILPNGNGKPPHNTGTGEHARFTPKVLQEQPAYNRAGDSPIMRTLTHGSKVTFFSRARDDQSSLRIKDGRVEGYGGVGTLAQFTVHVRCPGVICLQNVENPNHWIKPFNDELTIGSGGRKTELRVHEVDGYLVLESVKFPGQHVGILPNGKAKAPNHTGRGDHGRFTPRVIQPSPHRIFIAGRGPLQRLFVEGSTILLRARAHGRSLRIKDGRVEGYGEDGTLAQFIVWLQGPGLVGLMNKANNDHWLAIKHGELTSGGGLTFSSFIVKEVDGHVALESQVHKGQHVGIFPNGKAKKGNETGTGEHGQYTPIVFN